MIQTFDTQIISMDKIVDDNSNDKDFNDRDDEAGVTTNDEQYS